MTNTPEQKMWMNPFTGKVEPQRERVRPKVDLVDPKVLPPDTAANEYNACLAELKDLRDQFAKLQPGQRNGKTGDSIMKKYRHESAKLLHLAGEKAPPIYSEIG